MKDFFVPGKPQGKGRARVVFNGKFVQSYTPEGTANYENLIKVCYLNAYENSLTKNPIRLVITAYYPIPNNFSRKKRILAVNKQIWPTTKPDVDNIAKVVCDALNKVAYYDDNQIVSLSVEKFYGEGPGLQIQILEEMNNG